MLNNKGYHKKFILFFALLFVISMFLFLDAKAETEESKL